MKRIMISFLFSIMFTGIVFAEKNISVIEGRINLIEQDYIVLNNQKYSVIHDTSEENETDNHIPEVECWAMDSPEPYKIDFATLYGVGYVDKARVTLKNGIVHKIEVLEMKQ